MALRPARAWAVWAVALAAYVNVGGFVASLLTILLIGLILDARTGGTGVYDLGDFRVALAVQYLVGLFGLIGILRTRRLARRKLAEDGIVVRPIREVLAERRGLAPRRSAKPEGTDQASTVNSRRT